MCTRLASIAVPLRAALAVCQDGANEKSPFAQMDDGVRLTPSLFTPDSTAPPNGWPAIVFVHGPGGSEAAAPA